MVYRLPTWYDRLMMLLNSDELRAIRNSLDYDEGDFAALLVALFIMAPLAYWLFSQVLP